MTEQQVQNDEQFSAIAYKEHIHELFLKGKKRNELNQADTMDWRAGLAEDNHINNNLSYGDNNFGYHF